MAASARVTQWGNEAMGRGRERERDRGRHGGHRGVGLVRLSFSDCCPGKWYLQLGLELGFQVVYGLGFLLVGIQAHLLVHGELGQEACLPGQHPGGEGGAGS